MRRWVALVLLATGVVAGVAGYSLIARGFGFPGPTERAGATVLDSRAASCGGSAALPRVRFTMAGEDHVALLQEDDCSPARVSGETLTVYVLSDWPQHVGSCPDCLPADADDAPEVYAYQLGGLVLVALGFFAGIGGFALVAAEVGQTLRARRPRAV